jgi:preprotein translocase subunit YajC
MMAALVLALPLAAAAAKKSSGSPVLLIFVLIAAGFYFLIYRPQQRKTKALREESKSFDVGDEVLTAGGIVGHIIDIEGDRMTLETSVGASFVVLKPYVLRKIEEPVPVDSDEFEVDEDDDEQEWSDEDTDEVADHDGEPADDEEGDGAGDHPSASGQGGTNPKNSDDGPAAPSA